MRTCDNSVLARPLSVSHILGTMREILPGIFTWGSTYADRPWDLNGYAIRLDECTVLVDPPAPAEDGWPSFEEIGKALLINASQSLFLCLNELSVPADHSRSGNLPPPPETTRSMACCSFARNRRPLFKWRRISATYFSRSRTSSAETSSRWMRWANAPPCFLFHGSISLFMGSERTSYIRVMMPF